MPDMLMTTSAAGKVKLFLEWTQTNPNRCSVQFVRCENAHTEPASYTLGWRGSQVHTRTFPGQTVTREAVPGNVTLPLASGEPDLAEISISYSGPAE